MSGRLYDEPAWQAGHTLTRRARPTFRRAVRTYFAEYMNRLETARMSDPENVAPLLTLEGMTAVRNHVQRYARIRKEAETEFNRLALAALDAARMVQP